MSSDNCIAILKTTDKFKVENEYTLTNTFGKGITAYRVAHICAMDNFEYYIENELHNLGYWMYANFPWKEVVYSYEDAISLADKYCKIVGYTEYGIVNIDASKYNFPGC